MHPKLSAQGPHSEHTVPCGCCALHTSTRGACPLPGMGPGLPRERQAQLTCWRKGRGSDFGRRQKGGHRLRHRLVAQRAGLRSSRCRRLEAGGRDLGPAVLSVGTGAQTAASGICTQREREPRLLPLIGPSPLPGTPPPSRTHRSCSPPAGPSPSHPMRLRAQHVDSEGAEALVRNSHTHGWRVGTGRRRLCLEAPRDPFSASP